MFFWLLSALLCFSSLCTLLLSALSWVWLGWSMHFFSSLTRAPSCTLSLCFALELITYPCRSFLLSRFVSLYLLFTSHLTLTSLHNFFSSSLTSHIHSTLPRLFTVSTVTVRRRTSSYTGYCPPARWKKRSIRNKSLKEVRHSILFCTLGLLYYLR